MTRVFIVATDDDFISADEIKEAAEVKIANRHLYLLDDPFDRSIVEVSEVKGQYHITADVIQRIQDPNDPTMGIKQEVTLLVPSVDRAVEELTEAIRHTVEYVGLDMLPAVEGWSWYDALKRYAPEKAAAFHEVQSLNGINTTKPN